MNHTAWLNLTSYYSAAFKSGTYPPIVKDQLYMWARTHPANATASADTVGKPNNYQIMQDSMIIACFSTAPGNILVSTFANGTQARNYTISAGINVFNSPLNTTGGTMWAQLQRNGKTLLTLQPSTFKYVSNPTTYNYNAFVAGTS